MSDSKLTPEEEAFVELARKLAHERANQPDAEKNPLDSDKFNGPIGLDDDGKPLPALPPASRRP